MTGAMGTSLIHRRLADSLHVEAMVLADEARAYFDEFGRNERDALEAASRVAFSCESLKVTTRLMHIIAWLLTRRAVDTGEIVEQDARSPARRLGLAPDSDDAVLAAMPGQAEAIMRSSIDLYRRVARLDTALDDPVPAGAGPARSMIDRLSAAF
jgi:regulator of CtrA degradation